MRRESAERTPLIGNPRDKENHWDVFENKHTKGDSDSAVQSVWIKNGIKILKVFTIILTFSVVLGSAVISKGTLLFMISQIKENNTRPYCNKDLDPNKQFVTTLPEEQRVVWTWLLIFTFMVPQLGTFIRSVRIMCFKKWNDPDYSIKWEFLRLFFTESLFTVGSAFLVFIVLPELNVIKAVMLTNAVCFMPGVVTILSRNPRTIDSKLKMILDIMAIVAQASAFVVWPIVDGNPKLYFIPVSLLFISFGWWENYVSKESLIPFMAKWANKHKDFNNKTYFIYSILAPWKCILFFITTIIIIAVENEGNIDFLFEKFLDGFRPHYIDIMEVIPDINITEAVANGYSTTIQTSLWTPLSVWFINIGASYICYIFGKFACKVMIQSFSFALPINLSVPVLLTALIAMCGKYNLDVCSYKGVIPSYLFFNAPPLSDLNHFIAHQYSWIWLIWLLSQTWITVHIWTNNNKILVSTEKLFYKPMYDAYLVDQSIALNRRPTERRKQKKKLSINEITAPWNEDEDKITQIYACGTMWHETKDEMVQFLISILRMDQDQCAHRIVRKILKYVRPDYYEFETHIFFDDAFITTNNESEPVLNEYVETLIESIDTAASEVHKTDVKLKPPLMTVTPYGGKLAWTLPGTTKMIVHLKDKTKIKAKKRWSQVMYMYYLLGYKIMEDSDLPPERIKIKSENTYLLALDGDIDFQPEAVHLLVDRMKRNDIVGAACGRIHPVGSGVMAWYQIFEYGVAHWLQKATEHVLGCVLCSPGCFSLFRAKALMDHNVMAKYTTVSRKPRHFIQYDQGEDRWLCTLLLQRGYRVEYCAASDAYTHCPEGFSELYNQRRRWMPSTVANILDLLSDYRRIVRVNNNISMLYIIYQGILMVGTVIGPAAIFLLLLGAFVTVFELSIWASLACNLVPILLFILICATCKPNTQLFFAGIISAAYSLIMMAVVVGVLVQIMEDGWLAPTSLFIFCIVLVFITAALLHPQEFYCLKYGVVYYVTVPSMYMLLVIYSTFNMNNISWGTREVPADSDPNSQKEVNKEEVQPQEKKKMKHKIYSFFGNNKDNAGSFEFSFAGLFKLICCTHKVNREEYQMLKNIQVSLLQQQQKLEGIERKISNPREAETTPTAPNAIIQIEGSQAAVINSTTQVNTDINQHEQFSETTYYNPEIQDWFYEPRLGGPVEFLDIKEKRFWIDFLAKYLSPSEDINEKAKIEKELKDLRDKVVIMFVMLNSLFITIIFLLTLRGEDLFITWPFGPKINIDYSIDQNEYYVERTYLQLEPIGFFFLIGFALLIVLQFLAMIYHRFITFSQIAAKTDVDFFDSDNISKLTYEQLLEKNPVKVIKKFVTLEGINDHDNEMNTPVERRNTVHALAMNNRINRRRTIIENLVEAFNERLKRMSNGTNRGNLHVSEEMAVAVKRRKTVMEKRESQMAVRNHSERGIVNPGYAHENGV